LKGLNDARTLLADFFSSLLVAAWKFSCRTMNHGKIWSDTGAKGNRKDPWIAIAA
jgi:hypothetical protein